MLLDNHGEFFVYELFLLKTTKTTIYERLSLRMMILIFIRNFIDSNWRTCEIELL